MNILLLRYEAHVGLGPVDAARLLGYAYVTYSQWRSEDRDPQLYTRNHIHDIMALPEDRLNAIIKERVYDRKNTTKV